jgi:hypothetical protein
MIIQVERSTAKELKKLRIADKETYDEIIVRLICSHKKKNLERLR